MGETIVAICLVAALYVGFFYLLRWEVKRYKAHIAEAKKHIELYECILEKLNEG